jgi:ATP-dependent protease HslVU (ClpYQ) peptidase subunit
MSVIAYDGHTLAADRQGTCDEMRVTIRKVRRLSDGTLLGFVGGYGQGVAMVKWYESGANPASLPTSQAGENFAQLIVVKTTGEVIEYDQNGVAVEVIDCPMAWGSGREFAMGALAMGADARKAIEIASRFSTVCGLGVEAFDILQD